jgi:hypothetical protein
MAYTPPNSFTNNTSFVASAVKANDDALKIYLHEGIVGADLLNSAWVETRHVQAPVIDAFSGVQHGITGYQGAQWDGGTTVRAQFGSAFLTGKRYGANTTDNWEVVPQTCFSLDLRRQATVIFHWWMESVNGPDNGERTLGNDAYMWVTEYTAGGLPDVLARSGEQRPRLRVGVPARRCQLPVQPPGLRQHERREGLYDNG